MRLRNVLSLYFLATFLQAGTYGLTFLLPPLFAAFGADEKDVGTVLMSTTISTLVTVLYLGHITARLGRVNTIILASVLIAVALYLFAEATTFGVMLFIAGILLGVGWSLFYVLTPIVLTEITEKSERVRVFTLLSVFIMAGFGLSPVLGSSLVESGFRIDLTFKLTAALCLFSGAIFMLLRGAIAALSLGQGNEEQSNLSWAILCRVLRTRAVRPIMMVGIGASVFAAVTNFQTVFALENGLDYAQYFLAYTFTVIVCRVAFAEFMGGRSPYGTIAVLLGIMVASVICLVLLSDSQVLYLLGAILFGVGYGVSYPIVKAMAANDADPALVGQTLQILGFSYFIGVFGFPFIAGWMITTHGITALLILAAILALIECFMAGHRYMHDRISR